MQSTGKAAVDMWTFNTRTNLKNKQPSLRLIAKHGASLCNSRGMKKDLQFTGDEKRLRQDDLSTIPQ